MAILTFPTLVGIGYPKTKEILTQSLINKAVSGKRAVVAEWTYPIYRITLPINYMKSSPISGANQDWQAFTGFYKQLGGPALPFHWYDADDNSASNQSLGIGDGATQVFRFARTLGGATEPIQDVTAVSQVTVNGTPTGGYTLITDPNWGFVYALSFTTPPGAGQSVAASFTYNWPCEFEEDGLEMTKTAQYFWSAKKIKFITKKVI
jgi:uncharacterized protein (TIGR02217 family)